MSVQVDIQTDSKFPVSRKVIRERVGKVLAQQGINEPAYVSVAVVGDRKMRTMNRTYRDKDYATDVLSFPTFDPTQPIDDHGFVHSTEGVRVLGDILVSYPQALLMASRLNQMVDQVVADLVEHGLMHLLGHHHEGD